VSSRISLALRGRHAASGARSEAWEAVINQLREVEQIFSTYRDDLIINRLDQGELTIEAGPPEVRTGRPPGGVASVTVIAASLTWADSYATAAYVHGADAARWLQSRPIRSGLIVWADGTTTRLPTDLNQ
jgi:thiamine biosynthesis lipoprotein ApbE